MSSIKPLVINVPFDSIIPEELYLFTANENELLLKIGINLITETKKNLLCISNEETINNYKTDLCNVHESEIKEYLKKIKTLEEESAQSLKNQEKNHEAMMSFYKENVGRFDKTAEEFKLMNNLLQNELKEKNAVITNLNNTLIKNMAEEAIKRDDILQKILEQKNQSTVEIGKEGELDFLKIADDTFRDFSGYNGEHVAELDHVGDVHLFFKDFNILCDTKNHKSIVSKTHRDQILNDLKRNTQFKFAWLVSCKTKICKYNKAPFIFDCIVDDEGEKLYICYINNFDFTENKQELLRSIWYTCKTLYDDVIQKNNDNGELKKLKVFKDSTIKTLDAMMKTSREMNEQIKNLQKTKQVLDDAIKSITNNNNTLSINDKYFEIIKNWWVNIVDDPTNDLKMNEIFKRFSKDNKNNDVTAEDFRKIVISIVGGDKIIFPKSKNGSYILKGSKFCN